MKEWNRCGLNERWAQ